MRPQHFTPALLLALGLICGSGVATYAQDEPKPEDAPAAEAGSTSASESKEPDIVLDENGNLLPKHFNERTQKSIEAGMEFLSNSQSPDGSWRNTRDGSTYPVTMTSLAGMAMLAGGNTTSRGPYADNVKKAVRYILAQANPNTGIIAAATENGRTMYPHGFAMLFLSSAYGMESNEAIRDRMKSVIEKGIKLIASAQSNLGGWYYTPNSGDEGSVTVTQLQALRAAHNAGFIVPEDVIDRSIQYLEMCRTPDGGIRYSFNSGNSTRLPISAAALPCMYSTGDYESEMAEACLEYVFSQYCKDGRNKSWNKSGGHDFYGHYYAAQAFYQAGDEYWDVYFPAARDQLINMQGQGGEGAWNGDGIGPVYGTAMALTILQLPYKYLPIYQR